MFLFSKTTRPKVTLLQTLPHTTRNNVVGHFQEDMPSLLIAAYRLLPQLYSAK
jgi:hypothetical protein